MNKAITFILFMWLTVISIPFFLYLILNNLHCTDWTADLSKTMGRLISLTVLASVMTGLLLFTMIITLLWLQCFIRYHLNRIDSQVSRKNRDFISFKKRKALRRMLVLLSNFALCWLPALITTTLIFKLGYPSRFLITIRNMSLVVAFSYAVIGPVGYVSCCPDITRQLRIMWRKMR